MHITAPLISIIVPVYNAEKTINRCIDSILAQTYSHFELLLINDGSKDKSGEICDKYVSTDNRIKVFHQENEGVSAARNKGIDNAIGEYITFIDSDDYIDNTFLEDFKIETNSNIDLFVQGSNSIYNDKSKNNIIRYNNTDECELVQFYPPSIENNLILSPWSKLFRTTIIKFNNIYFDKSICYGEDRIFVAEYIFHCKNFNILSAHGYNYMHENDNCLTNIYHSGHKIYKFAITHFNIIRKIHKTVTLPQDIIEKDILQDVLALYNSILLVIEDKSISNKERINFIKNLDKDFMKESYKYNLPTRYRFIRATYKFLPTKLFIFAVKSSLIFK